MFGLEHYKICEPNHVLTSIIAPTMTNKAVNKWFHLMAFFCDSADAKRIKYVSFFFQFEFMCPYHSNVTRRGVNRLGLWHVKYLREYHIPHSMALFDLKLGPQGHTSYQKPLLSSINHRRSVSHHLLKCRLLRKGKEGKYQESTQSSTTPDPDILKH